MNQVELANKSPEAFLRTHEKRLAELAKIATEHEVLEPEENTLAALIKLDDAIMK